MKPTGDRLRSDANYHVHYCPRCGETFDCWLDPDIEGEFRCACDEEEGDED